MSRFSAADVLELTVSERLRLVEEIWDSIAAVPESLPLTEDEKRLLDQRLAAFERDPQAGSPWSEVRSRITSRKR